MMYIRLGGVKPEEITRGENWKAKISIIFGSDLPYRSLLYFLGGVTEALTGTNTYYNTL